MPLSFLYRGHAEICSWMAATAKDAEIREQWTELSEHWRSKAEADAHQAPLFVSASNSAYQSPNLVPEVMTPLAQEPVAAAQAPGFVCEATTPMQEPLTVPQGPSLVAEATPTLHQEPVPATSNAGGLDAIWAKIAGPINLGD
jgi:hypothetical protein